MAGMSRTTRPFAAPPSTSLRFGSYPNWSDDAKAALRALFAPIWRATIMLAGVAAKVLAGDEESKAA